MSDSDVLDRPDRVGAHGCAVCGAILAPPVVVRLVRSHLRARARPAEAGPSNLLCDAEGGNGYITRCLQDAVIGVALVEPGPSVVPT